MKIVLTIAGSDTSGGAGIQGDIKTLTANGVYGMSAVTALTAQNTHGASRVYEVDPEFYAEQLDAVFTDFKPDAVKVGIMYAAGLIKITAEKIRQYDPPNVVIDPVMLSARRFQMVEESALEILKEELLPLADIITPDINDVEMLSGIKADTEINLINATRYISEQYGCAVVTKGGRKTNDARDLLFNDGYYKWFPGKVILNPNRHGAGAALSCAVAANLAKGYDIDKAFKLAKDFVTVLLDAGFDVGSGKGPVNHCAAVNGPFAGIMTDEEISKFII